MLDKDRLQNLSHPGLLKTVARHFNQVPDPSGPDGGIPLQGCLLSGLVLFGLKYPSLLQFGRDRVDNAPAESFFHTLKTELCHHERYATRAQAKQSIFEYIEVFYNRKRRHSTIGYVAPLKYEEINRKSV